MSQKATYPIHCPKCRHEQRVELYESVNVQTDPELKARLLGNQLNIVTCAECKATFRVDKSLLYNDPSGRRMIYLLPLGEQSFEAGQRQFTESLQKLNGLLPRNVPAPEISLVFSWVELVERIFLFDAGLNERVIEYIKYLIYTHNSSRVNVAEKALLFNAQDSTPQMLCFVVQDVKTKKLESMLQYDRKTYQALCETFDRDDQTPSLLELFPGPYVSARALLLREAARPRPETPGTG